ncbi:ABC-2 family transporter protein [Sodalis endosymbiont of Spalangia cameroni]|uniref:ABC transporter permease n=1 Tax=Sodalis praecaptivus TaxID=1239307 RepID=UPI0031F78976
MENFEFFEVPLYYLAVLVTTILTSCNSVWEMNENIRLGDLSFWLMRPVHPFINYGAITLAELGLSLIVALPLLLLAFTLPTARNTFSWQQSLMLLCAFTGGLLLNQAIHLLIGCLTFWMERSLVVHKVYAAASSVLSGFMFPLTFLPDWAGRVARWLPFRFVISLPVEIFTGKHSPLAAAFWLTVQAIMVAALYIAAMGVWRLGIRRYTAFG